MSNKESGAERREYFRIKDSIRLSIEVVAEDDFETRLRRLESGIEDNFTIMSSLSSISANMAGSFHKIEAKNPDVADYLKCMNEKLDLIGRAFLAKESEGMSEHTAEVNLSAGGMSLGVDETYDNDAKVEIRMLLYPSFTGVLTYGTVVSCKQVDEESYQYELSVKFTHLSESDRDILIRHIMRRQGSLLRERREKQDSEM